MRWRRWRGGSEPRICTDLHGFKIFHHRDTESQRRNLMGAEAMVWYFVAASECKWPFGRLGAGFRFAENDNVWLRLAF
jgi:hypothetical protein